MLVSNRPPPPPQHRHQAPAMLSTLPFINPASSCTHLWLLHAVFITSKDDTFLGIHNHGTPLLLTPRSLKTLPGVNSSSLPPSQAHVTAVLPSTLQIERTCTGQRGFTSRQNLDGHAGSQFLGLLAAFLHSVACCVHHQPSCLASPSSHGRSECSPVMFLPWCCCVRLILCCSHPRCA